LPKESFRLKVRVLELDPLAVIPFEGLAVTELAEALALPGDRVRIEEQTEVSPELAAWT
jgi:hypothetical protein